MLALKTVVPFNDALTWWSGWWTTTQGIVRIASFKFSVISFVTSLTNTSRSLYDDDVRTDELDVGNKF